MDSTTRRSEFGLQLLPGRGWKAQARSHGRTGGGRPSAGPSDDLRHARQGKSRLTSGARPAPASHRRLRHHRRHSCRSCVAVAHRRVRQRSRDDARTCAHAPA